MATFILCGTLMGTWVVPIPAIEERVGISHATPGSLLVLLGLGAFTGMQGAGRLADRLGARVTLPVAGVLSSTAVVLPGLPRDPWMPAGALLVFGFCNGLLDVSTNAHAVHVEKAYNRPVMSAFHAMFSVGDVFASPLVGAGAASAGMSPAAGMGAMGFVGVALRSHSGEQVPSLTAQIARASNPDGMTARPSRRVVSLTMPVALLCCDRSA